MNASIKNTNKFEQAVAIYTRRVIRWRWPVVIGTLMLAAIVAQGARFLTFATDYRAFFSGENPQLIAFEALQNIYTKNDNILFVLAPKNGEVFTPSTLSAVEKLTEAAWQIPFAIRVDAVTNFQQTRVDGDELFVGDLIEDAANQPLADLEQARRIALAEPALVKRLISEQAEVTGVHVTQQFPGKDMSEVPESVTFARQLAHEIEQQYPGIDVYVTGVTLANNAFIEASRNDMQTLIPLMFLAMLAIMVICLRSVSGTFATVMVVILATATAMGMAGWFRTGLTAPSAQAPTIIMTLAIADCIHILVTLLRQMAKGSSKTEAIVQSMQVNIQPVFLTSVTTAIGFLCLNFSDVPPFHHLGNITAFGVIVAGAFSMFFLPAFIAILPIKVRKQRDRGNLFIDRIANLVIKNQRKILATTAIVTVLLGIFIARNELNDGFVDYFDESNAFRRDSDFAEKHLTGIYQIDYSLGAGESGGINEPRYLVRLDEFANWFRQQPNVRHVAVYTDILKRLNRNMHGNAAEFYRIPESRELAAQYLLLYEMSLPFGLDLNNKINIDKSATRLTVTLADVTSKEIVAATEKAEQWLRQNAPAAMFTYGTGASVMFARISEINIKSMIKGGLLGLILISGILVFALRDVKIGLLSLIPNLLPIVMAFGLWGIISGEVNTAIAV
ncbi:MAG: RND family transporter, partial [Candidatus Poribacteria bacterium]